MTAPIALFRGEDTYAIELAIARLAIALGEPGPPLPRWRIEAGDERAAMDRVLDRIAEHIGTAPLFGGGELVVVGGVAALARDRGPRERLIAILRVVPPGNGLALVDIRDGSAKRTAASDPLGEAVEAAGGAVTTFPAMNRDRMTGWLAERAAELGVRLGPGAAQELTQRVGAQVREGDIDRRLQAVMANGELEKLALYRPSGVITKEDVAALVPEAVPGSAWALLDAVGGRQAGVAATLAERLLAEGTPLQVLVARLHGRLRELVVAADHLAASTRPADLVRAMRLQPFRAQRLAEQAATWTTAELDGAVEGLLAVDLASKGIGEDGGPAPTSDERGRLALDLWLTERVARRPSDRRTGAAGGSVRA